MASTMSRRDHFCAGQAEGEREAESDQRSSVGVAYMRITMDEYRHEATLAHANRSLGPDYENYAAWALGRARGYRFLYHM